jgi:signal transduction histidine kinase
MVEFETNEGKTLYLFAIIKPLKEGYAMSFSDITLLKRLQEKQCFTNSFEIVGEISSSVVHEIKNYLQPAKLLIEQEEIDKQDKKRVVNIIHKIDILVNEFLKTGRPIDKLLAIELNIAHEFKTILHLLEAQIKAKKLIIETDINEELTLFIAEKDLETILVNLLENAIDESCEASKIIIHVFKNQQDIIIEITDFGKGIDKTVLKDIYKPFFTTKGEKGSGIGLYTTYKIVYMYQGHIDVQSTHEKTTFSISLPQQLKDKQ